MNPVWLMMAGGVVCLVIALYMAATEVDYSEEPPPASGLDL